jgi:hypothetical protein
VRSRREALKHYFSCPGGRSAVSIKSAPGDVMPNVCFCIRWDLRLMKCIPLHQGQETSMHYFSCSSGPIVVFIKSVAGHVTPNLCFCIRWDLWVTYYILVRSGHETSTHYFSCLVGPMWFPKNACRDTLRRTCVFISSGICGSRSALWCV